MGEYVRESERRVEETDRRNRREPPAVAFADPWIVAGLALGLGIAADTLALHQPAGLGLALGLWLGIIVVTSAPYLMDGSRPRTAFGFAAAAMVLSAFVAVRSSPVLLVLNVGATAVLVAAISQLRQRRDLGRWTLASYAVHPLSLAVEVIDGSIGFARADMRTGFPERHRARTRAIGLGVLIGAPLVVVFASLFASADVSFDAYLQRLTSAFALESAAARVFGSVVIAVVVAGLWRNARRPRDVAVRSASPDRAPRLEPMSAATVLALLVVLFSLFVLTQVLGHNPDLVTPQDYSTNARSGFFQLFAVACLVLTVLLAFDWLIRSGDGSRSATFDRLAVALIALTGIVMASAMSRMRLYVDEFGLTELRLYTSVFMVWLGFVLLWFIVTVLRNRHARFAFGLLVSGVAAIVALNVANPDALIVRFNWDRHLDGATFAADYAASLSADSIPELVAIVEQSAGDEVCEIESRLVRERATLDTDREMFGILGDSWSDYRARRALARLGDRLGEGCG